MHTSLTSLSTGQERPFDRCALVELPLGGLQLVSFSTVAPTFAMLLDSDAVRLQHIGNVRPARIAGREVSARDWC